VHPGDIAKPQYNSLKELAVAESAQGADWSNAYHIGPAMDSRDIMGDHSAAGAQYAARIISGLL
jgi:hypothetical protein